MSLDHTFQMSMFLMAGFCENLSRGQPAIRTDLRFQSLTSLIRQCASRIHRPSPVQQPTPRNSRSSGFRNAGSSATISSRSFPNARSRLFMKLLSFVHAATNLFQKSLGGICGKDSILGRSFASNAANSEYRRLTVVALQTFCIRILNLVYLTPRNCWHSE